MAKSDAPVISKLLEPDAFSFNAKPIDIARITIAQLEKIVKESAKFTTRRGQCYLRYNPTKLGYTYVRIAGGRFAAHRVIQAIATGRDNPYLVVDHLCRNRSCVRLAHLESVTHAENTRRGRGGWNLKLLAKDTCGRGHPFDAENTYIKSNGTKSCRKCHAARERNRRLNGAI